MREENIAAAGLGGGAVRRREERRASGGKSGTAAVRRLMGGLVTLAIVGLAIGPAPGRNGRIHNDHQRRAAGRTDPVRRDRPATGKVIAQVPECSRDQLDEAMESAAKGVPGLLRITPWNYPLLLAVWKIAPALSEDHPDNSQPRSVVLDTDA